MAEPIAIVGLGARFPGCRTPDELWELIAARGHAFRAPPPGRWPVQPEAALSERIGAVDHIYVAKGAFLDEGDMPQAPPGAPRDPLFRLALAVGLEAWRDGVTAGLDLGRVGVVLGNLFLPTATQSAWGRGELGTLGPDRWSAHGPAQFLADQLGLRGGAEAVDAACASSLYALALAVRRLRRREADAMLAGGISRPDCLYTQMGFCQLRALSTLGQPRPFGAGADGMLVGEGGAIFLLKRLSDAMRDGDFIHGLIHAVGLANDRQGNLLAPASEGQLRAMRAAYAEAGWRPEEVDFIECHATGTPVGDQVELNSLLALHAESGRTEPIALGSLKANLGHTLTAAGAAGLLKMLLALRRKELPPQPEFGAWTAEVSRRFRTLGEAEPWAPPRTGQPRRAAVSAFGFGGIDAHLLLEEWRPERTGAVDAASAPPAPAPFAVRAAAVREQDEVDLQELAGLGIPPLGLAELIREQKLMLALARELRDGPPSAGADWKNAAVVIGLEQPEEPLFYGRRWTLPAERRDAAAPKLTPDRTLGSLGSVVASRVARLLGCGGPCFALSAGQEPLDRLLEAAQSVADDSAVSHVLIGWIPFGDQAGSLAEEWRKRFPEARPLPKRFAAFLACLTPQRSEPHAPPAESAEVLTYAQCLEFARGSAAKALGPRFALLDAVPVRVRLPDEPLMLVDRVTAIEAEPLSLKPGRIVTEHDVKAGDWHLDGGRMPTSLSVESGQADLLLVGYLGIDLETKGEAVYRLLDAQITLHRGLPKVGETVRYDIRIERFQRHGAIHLFFFSYDATIAGQPFLTMRQGCAGFFGPEELRSGEGLVLSGLPRPRPSDRWLEPKSPLTASVIARDQLQRLRAGDLEGTFGPAFRDQALTNALRPPGGRLAVIDQIDALEPEGGRFGRGLIRSSLSIHPDDWHLVCHFKDDPVMPGTLMYECCLQTLRVWLLRAGFFSDAADAVAEPVVGAMSKLKCRGQVIPSTRAAQFEIHLKETGFNPNVYALADAILLADGKPIVFVENLSLQFTGVTAAEIERQWRKRGSAAAPVSAFARRRILEFALGKPSRAFGPPYRPFDADRVIARLPAPPYQFLDRIETVEAEPFALKEGGRIVAAYDLPPDAWFFAAARSESLPFAVLLEVALQPCGWLAAYLGSALSSAKDLSFRNLGGEARLLRPVGRDAGALRTEVTVTKIAQSLDMIIQHFRFAVRAGAEPAYEGTTYFGFFTREALAQQEGLRGVERWREPAGAGMPLSQANPGPNADWSMLSTIRRFAPAGGAAGLGEIVGAADVDPRRWFYAAHFHQDPVWPGSLGLEAFLQAVRAFAALRWPRTPLRPYPDLVPGATHQWVYRGQVPPDRKEVVVRAEMRAADEATRRLTADGVLYADGLPIYQMSGFQVALA